MNAESVKARLKNFAEKNGQTFQEALTYYGLERTIYRISISKYSDFFVLKGGIFLYAIHGRNYERATTDIDFLACRISNSGEEMKKVFENILALEVDDALVFDTSSVMVEDITEFKEYHGLHVSAVGYLDRTRIPIGIDIGFGDVIYPNAVKIEFPVMLNMEPPMVNAYSLETVIAEKLEAIIRNGYYNSRYKDFYDLYILSLKHVFTFEELKHAVSKTFENRKTVMTMATSAFGDDFINDPLHLSRWQAFLKKKNAMVQIPLTVAMERIKVFSEPLLERTRSDLIKWNPNKGLWE